MDEGSLGCRHRLAGRHGASTGGLRPCLEEELPGLSPDRQEKVRPQFQGDRRQVHPLPGVFTADLFNRPDDVSHLPNAHSGEDRNAHESLPKMRGRWQIRLAPTKPLYVQRVHVKRAPVNGASDAVGQKLKANSQQLTANQNASSSG